MNQNTYIPAHVQNDTEPAAAPLRACPHCGRPTGLIAVEDMACPYRQNQRKHR